MSINIRTCHAGNHIAQQDSTADTADTADIADIADIVTISEAIKLLENSAPTPKAFRDAIRRDDIRKAPDDPIKGTTRILMSSVLAFIKKDGFKKRGTSSEKVVAKSGRRKVAAKPRRKADQSVPLPSGPTPETPAAVVSDPAGVNGEVVVEATQFTPSDEPARTTNDNASAGKAVGKSCEKDRQSYPGHTPPPGVGSKAVDAEPQATQQDAAHSTAPASTEDPPSSIDMDQTSETLMSAQLFHAVLHPGEDYAGWLAETAASYPADIITPKDGRYARIRLVRAKALAFLSKGCHGAAALKLVIAVENSGDDNPGAVADALSTAMLASRLTQSNK